MCLSLAKQKKQENKTKSKKTKKTKKLNKYIPMIVFVYARMLFLFL